MGGKKTNADNFNIFYSLFLDILVLPVYIFKFVGDLTILLFKLFLLLVVITYKITVSLILSAIKIFLSPIFFFKRIKIGITSAKKIKGKRGILYGKSPIFKSISNKLREQKRELIIKLKTSFPFYSYRQTVKKRIRLFLFKTKYFLFGAVFFFLVFALVQMNAFIKDLPNPKNLTDRDLFVTTKIMDRNGKLLYEIYNEENRTPIDLSTVPKYLIDATLSAEDNEFYFHEGFSVRGIIRAFIHNLNSVELEGGSTITQQLIRSAYLSPEKTLMRKFKEIILSIWTEQIYSKDQILQMYLNQVSYGGTAYGIEAASRTYFGKDAKDLTIAQSAMLAGLPASPSIYSPYNKNGNLYKRRQEEILFRMLSNGYIKQKDYQEAFEEKLTIRAQRTPIAAPHFVMYIKNLLEKNYGTRMVNTGGLRVTTSLDLNLNNEVQRQISEKIENLQNLNVSNAAALVTDPKTGEILAMVGSKDYFDTKIEGNTNVVLSQRQPGSSIKVVTYSMALSNGFTAASILNDSPITYRYSGQPPYTPINYDGKYHGKVTLRTALASSYNVPAVKVLETIGLDKMIEQGKKMGITTWEDKSRYGLSLTLGAGEVTMLDMAKVYGSLANNGIRKDLNAILKISDYKGNDIPLISSQKDIQAVTPQIAFILASILSDNQARTPAFGVNSALYIPGKTIAVKTGTSDNKRDNWTIGFTPDVVTVVWVGNNDNSPMHPSLTSGITGAAPIWNGIMNYILKDRNDAPFEVPNGITISNCQGKREFFVKGTESKSCSINTKSSKALN